MLLRFFDGRMTASFHSSLSDHRRPRSTVDPGSVISVIADNVAHYEFLVVWIVRLAGSMAKWIVDIDGSRGLYRLGD